MARGDERASPVEYFLFAGRGSSAVDKMANGGSGMGSTLSVENISGIVQTGLDNIFLKELS